MNNLKQLKQARHIEDKAISMMLSTPDGKVFSIWLDKIDRRLLRKTPDGVVDPNAIIYAAAQHDLIKLIKDLEDDRKLAG